MSDIMKAINEAVDKRVFTGEGLDAIVAIRQRAEALEKTLTETGKQLTGAQTALSAKITENSNLMQRIAEASAREDELVKRERAVFEHEKAAAVSAARAEAYKDAFHITFKNPVVKETVMRGGSINSPSGGYQNTSSTDTTTRTAE